MDRKKFLKKALTVTIASVAAPKLVTANALNDKKSDYDKFKNQIGYNHLPNKEDKTMNTVLHKASTRGEANHGWLNSKHTFSFANYHNPERMHFGALRVLNDDNVAAGRGFGKHPHDNMEIISIPLEGDLEHQDSLGNTAVIKKGDVQVLSAGTGIFHSEYNKNKDQAVKFLQIWLFPNKKQVEPRYDQITLASLKKENDFYQILSPNKNDEGVWIHQNAWFNLGEFTTATEKKYNLNATENGVYVFVLEGQAIVEEQHLDKRDGFGVWNVSAINIKADKGTRLLLMEVPMNI